MSGTTQGGDSVRHQRTAGRTGGGARTAILAMISLCTAAALAGCAANVSVGQVAATKQTPTAELFETRVVVGESVEGRPIEVAIMGTGDDVTFILATIHGDEPAGTALCQQLILHLREQPGLLEGRRVVVMPVANPDGKAESTRTNVRSVDLNRNFPSSNRVNSEQYGLAALSEPEARAVHRLIDTQRPRRVVSIHQPLACVDFDGPAEDLAERMSAASDLPVRKLGAQPGSLGSYVGYTLGRPIVTLELPANAQHTRPDDLWEQYGDALVEAIVFGRAGVRDRE